MYSVIFISTLTTVTSFQVGRSVSASPSVIRRVATVDEEKISTTTTPFVWPDEISEEKPLRVVIAGAGVGGLTLANALSRLEPKVQVTILEKTSQFRRFGGPIQLASNAMQILKTLDHEIYSQIESKFTWTGNLTNGIKDGIRDEWYAKFDLKAPAANRNMPFTGVIERPELQEILLSHLKPGTVQNGKAVVSYAQQCALDDETCPVVVELSDDSRIGADVLVGADGIWSEVRAAMRNEPSRGEGSGATYSGYTVFAGELDYDSPDEGEVGYKVYIGPAQYFVITNIGPKRYQWYAFLARPPNSAETEAMPNGAGIYLQNLFQGWSKDVHSILQATRDDQIEQRDLYDRPPTAFKGWSDGPVALLGDSIHSMMPNLGQGGCQAIEDAMVLTEELEAITKRTQVDAALKNYRDRRLIRSAAVQGLSRFASDIIIRGFDTPAAIIKKDDGSVKFENFNYAGIVTRMMQPILPIFFTVQFNYLYDGWENKNLDFKAGLAIAGFGLILLVLAAGAVGDIAVLLPFVDITALAELGTTISEAVSQLLPNLDGVI